MFLLNKYPALGTLFWVEVFDKELSEERGAQVAGDIESFIINFENRFSRFKEDSLVSQLSRNQRVPFDKDLFAMLSLGVSLEKKTGGLFSLFIGNKMIEKGYGKDEFLVSSQMAKNKHEVWQEGSEIVIGSSDGIDLGGIGKGYLIDLLAKRLEEKWEMKEFLINGGGDIYATERDGKGIPIFLEHPLEEGSALGSIEIFHQGFAASSSFKRMWEKEGKKVNHFLAKEEEVWGAVFTVATNTTLADVYTKVILLSVPFMQKEGKLLEQLEESGFVPFMLVHESGVYVSPDFPAITKI